jgi:hypothetical protein
MGVSLGMSPAAASAEFCLVDGSKCPYNEELEEYLPSLCCSEQCWDYGDGRVLCETVHQP